MATLISTSTAANGRTGHIYETVMAGRTYTIYEPTFQDTARSYLQACVVFEKRDTHGNRKRVVRWLNKGPTFTRLVKLLKKEVPDLIEGMGIYPH